MQPILFILAALALIGSGVAAQDDAMLNNSTIVHCDSWTASIERWGELWYGYGATEEEALADLWQILRDELEARRDARQAATAAAGPKARIETGRAIVVAPEA